MAAALAGCGADDLSNTIDPVAKAADVTSKAGSAAVHFTATMSVGGQSIPMTGTGVVATRAPAQAQMTMTFPIAGNQMRMREVIVDRRMYMSGGPLEGKVPHGKTWMRIDLFKLLAEQGFDTSRLDNGGASATQTLGFLRAAGHSEKVGAETIDGVDVVHYHADIDMDKAARLIGDAHAQAFMRKAIGSHRTESADVWIDTDDHVRRVKMDVPMMQGNSMSMTMDLKDFGRPLHITAPPASDTFDATDRARRGMQALG